MGTTFDALAFQHLPLCIAMPAQCICAHPILFRPVSTAYICDTVKPFFNGHLNIQEKVSLHDRCPSLHHRFPNMGKIHCSQKVSPIDLHLVGTPQLNKPVTVRSRCKSLTVNLQ